MTNLRRSKSRAVALLLCALLANTAAIAQGYPTRAVTLINPYPPGGGADVVATPWC